jgi:hypothetical protein
VHAEEALLTLLHRMNFSSADVVSNPIANASNWYGPPVSSGDPGVQLSVGAGIPQNGYVQVAQMNSVREDLLFGTYRALLKITPVAGTCSSFFWVSISLFPVIWPCKTPDFFELGANGFTVLQ